jgi:hypothetical protein
VKLYISHGADRDNPDWFIVEPRDNPGEQVASLADAGRTVYELEVLAHRGIFRAQPRSSETEPATNEPRQTGERKPISDDEFALLRSYENGPKIWDATAILPGVWALEAKGLIEPFGDERPGVYRLTETGRKALKEAS